MHSLFFSSSLSLSLSFSLFHPHLVPVGVSFTFPYLFWYTFIFGTFFLAILIINNLFSFQNCLIYSVEFYCVLIPPHTPYSYWFPLSTKNVTLPAIDGPTQLFFFFLFFLGGVVVVCWCLFSHLVTVSSVNLTINRIA